MEYGRPYAIFRADIWQSVTSPAAKYENEINHISLKNGDQVQITGAYVHGTRFGGGAATNVWVFAPKFVCSGYVNASYPQ